MRTQHVVCRLAASCEIFTCVVELSSSNKLVHISVYRCFDFENSSSTAEYRVFSLDCGKKLKSSIC